MFEAVATLVDEHAALEGQLSQPETHADARLAKRLNQRYAELTAIVTTWREWQQAGEDIQAARELDDPDLNAEADRAGGPPRGARREAPPAARAA